MRSEHALAPRKYADVNAIVGGFLRDLAQAQASPQRAFGYKRAAAAIFALDAPLTQLLQSDRTLPKISGIGPASTRVILEILDTGTSPTVERAVALSERRAEIERRRALRSHFLSRAEVRRSSTTRHSTALASRTTGAISKCTQSGATALPRSTKSSKRASSEATVRGRHGSLARTCHRERNVDGRGDGTTSGH